MTENIRISALIAVTFDSELGQSIEAIHPPLNLTQQEKSNICYLSFPDSNSACFGDTKYFFRIRRTSEDPEDQTYKDEGDRGHFWGFVHFRQRRDELSPRGYFQKSFVILTRFPHIKFFQDRITENAEKYFQQPTEECLADIFEDISSLEISRPYINPPSEEFFKFLSHPDILPHVNLIWELVLCGENLVVVGNSPAATAEVVTGLVDIIEPLEYAGEYRPYFTIHDSEFKEFSTTNSRSPQILGITNPFLVKIFENSTFLFLSPPSIKTKVTSFTKTDKNLIKKINAGQKNHRPLPVQSLIHRKYFEELTKSFLYPLERYAGSLLPLQKQISPFKAPPAISSFDENEFLKNLGNSGPELTSSVRGKWKDLYKSFFGTGNFGIWFTGRRRFLEDKLKAVQLEALADLDASKWSSGKTEVEIVDLVLRLRGVLQEVGGAVERGKIEKKLEEVRDLVEDEELRGLL